MKRIEWIDALKGLGVFYVAFAHLNCFYPIERYINSFNMFMFFILSGLLHGKSDSGFLNFFLKKTKTILLPFFCWNALSCLNNYLLDRDLGAAFRYLFVLDGEIFKNAPLWFLLVLYMVQISYYFIKKIPFAKYICIPILFVLWMVLPAEKIIFRLNILPVCLLFYILGDVLSGLLCKPAPKSYWKYLYVLPILALLLQTSIYFANLNVRVAFTLPRFGNIWYCTAAALAGAFFYIILFRNVPFLGGNKLLSYLGKNSLVIMAAQYWIFYQIDWIFFPYLKESLWEYESSDKAFVLSAVTILVICGLTELFRLIGKWLPFLRSFFMCFGIRPSIRTEKAKKKVTA